LLALTLAWTGARPSEVLALVPLSFDVDRSVVAIVTLKRRKHHVREVPIPPWLMEQLDQHFRLRERQRDLAQADALLWHRHRVTLWRIIKHAMMLSQVVGRAACPRGLRHSFGIGTLQSGVPIHMTQKWMGHARPSSTAVYADACGPEEMAFAERFWIVSSGQDATAIAPPIAIPA
jgi:integrase